MMTALICDDILSDVEQLSDILDYSYGVEMRTRVFFRSSDALSYIRSGAPVDVFFIEPFLSGMNGIELARAIRAYGYKGGIIFISYENSFGTESYEVGAVDYLRKPLMPEAVRRAVNQWKTRLK